MSQQATQVVLGIGVTLVGVAFVVDGVGRMKRAKFASAEPLDSWAEHYLTFGLLPSSVGSRRRVEYLAAGGELLGGVVALVSGLVIAATGFGL